MWGWGGVVWLFLCSRVSLCGVVWCGCFCVVGSVCVGLVWCGCFCVVGSVCVGLGWCGVVVFV